MDSSPTRTDTGRSAAYPDHLINAKAAYDTYMAESTAAYQTYVANLAAARSGRSPQAQQTIATSSEPVAKPAAYRAGLAAVRQAGLPAVWAAGLIAARAGLAYWKYIADLSALQPAAVQPPAELSNAERAAAAAAESAAAYLKYVAGPAAGIAASGADPTEEASAAEQGGVSDADQSAVKPVAEQSSASPDGWTPAV